jgi:hypothetical protein
LLQLNVLLDQRLQILLKLHIEWIFRAGANDPVIFQLVDLPLHFGCHELDLLLELQVRTLQFDVFVLQDLVLVGEVI